LALLLLGDAFTPANPTPDEVPVTRLFFFIAPSPRAHLDLIGRLTRALTRGTLSDVIAKGSSDAEIFVAAATADRMAAAGQKKEEQQ
jgi:PTS system nitrogen regulatory IIA component